MNTVDKKYFLSPNELSVMSAGFGISMLYGLKQIDCSVDNKEICMALHNMYVNQIIENKNDGFTTDRELADILRVIKASKQLVVMEYKTENMSGLVGCYVSENCAVTEESSSYPGKVIVYSATLETVADYVIEQSENTEINVRVLDTGSGRTIEEYKLDGNNPSSRDELINRYKEAN